MNGKQKYLAFISYKREDEKWAKWLQHKLEHYKLPTSARRGNPLLPERVKPIFKDTTDLAGGVLEKAIREALDSSKYLIVICSPRAVLSPWVSKEVQEFIDSGREENIIPFIVSGGPNAMETAKECFPQNLRELSGSRELLGININEMGREAAAIKVVARMFGLQFDTLWQRWEREKKLRLFLSFLVIAMIVLAVAFSASCFYEQNQRLLTNQSRSIAQLAHRLIDEGNLFAAYRICIEALPKRLNQPNRPYVDEVEIALRRVVDSISKKDSAVVQRVISSGLQEIYANYSFDGSKIITKSEGGNLYVRCAKTGKCITKIYCVPPIYTPCFSPQGDAILASTQNKVIMWDIKSKEQLLRIDSLPGINNVAFNKEGTLIYGSGEEDVYIWDVRNGEERLHLRKESKGILSAKENLIASLTNDSIVIRDIRDTSIRRLIGISEKLDLNGMKFTPDGERIVTIHGNYMRSVLKSDGVINIYDVNSGEKIHRILIPADPITSFAFNSAGRVLICGSANSFIYFINIDTGELLKKYKNNYSDGYISSVSLCDNETDLLVSTSEGWVIDYKEISSPRKNSWSFPPFYGVFSQNEFIYQKKDTLFVYNCEEDQTFPVLDLSEYNINISRIRHSQRIPIMRCRNSYILADGSNTIIIKNAKTGEKIVIDTTDPLIDIVKEKYVFIWNKGYNPRIIIVDSDDMQVVADYKISSSKFAVSKNRNWVAYYNAAKKWVSVINPITREECSRISCTKSIRDRDFAPNLFSPEGSKLLCSDGVIYDVASGNAIFDLGDSKLISFSPNGNLILTCHGEKYYRLYALKSQGGVLIKSFDNKEGMAKFYKTADNHLFLQIGQTAYWLNPKSYRIKGEYELYKGEEVISIDLEENTLALSVGFETRVIDLNTGELLNVFTQKSNSQSTPAYIGNIGKNMLFCNRRRSVKFPYIVEVVNPNGKKMIRLNLGLHYAISATKILEDSKFMVTNITKGGGILYEYRPLQELIDESYNYKDLPLTDKERQEYYLE